MSGRAGGPGTPGALCLALGVAITLSLASPASAQGDEPAPPTAPPPSRDWYVGATFTANSAGWGQLLRTADVTGALVVLVIDGSPSQSAGLAPGDVVVAMDRQLIRNDRQPGLILRTSSGPGHDLTVVGPNGTARQVRIEARSRPPTGLNELATAQVAADPSPASRLLLAQLTSDAGTALLILEGLLGQFPGVAEAFSAKAQRLLDIGVARDDRSVDRVSAIRGALDHALALDPASLSVRLTAARVLTTLGEDDGAASHAERAIAIDATSATAHYLLGVALLSQGQAERAVPELRRAVDLDPYVPDSYRALSDAFRAAGHTGLARDTDRALESLGAGGDVGGGDSASPAIVAIVLALALAAGGGLALARPAQIAADSPALANDNPAPSTGLASAEIIGALGLFSLLVPSIGRTLDLAAGASVATEVVDHVVPGLAALVVAISLVRSGGRGTARGGQLWFLAGLAGFWVTATHLPLLADALGGRVRLEPALCHSVGGFGLLCAAWRLRSSPPWRLASE
ncbi:MAG: hypothetical protein ACRD2W_08005 [Acidimicrobiales bacterium]